MKLAIDIGIYLWSPEDAPFCFLGQLVPSSGQSVHFQFVHKITWVETPEIKKNYIKLYLCLAEMETFVL